MRLVTFDANDNVGPRPGVLRDDVVLALTHLGIAAKSMRELLAGGNAALRAVRQALDGSADQALPLDRVTLLAPVGDADKFLCVGKNYRTHLEELNRTGLIKELPQEPTAFIKLNSALVGHEATVPRPPSVTALDYEPELVFVIGKRAHHVRAEDALHYIAGITLLNDLTCRDTQKREVVSGSRFWTAKNAPGFGPLGPAIITMDEVPDPYDIWVTCRVNGQERMRVNTSDQIWRIGEILAHFSRLLVLEPGDMFSTGAPGGVAVGQPNAHELFLKPGDTVECSFEQPDMTLTTHIV